MAAHQITSTVVTVEPGVYESHVGIKSEAWSSGLYSCYDDMDICCFGLWCPWCLACKTSSEFGEDLCMPLVDILCGATAIPATALAMRTAMRERYHIQGSMCDDCCIVTCFHTLAWCQMARELKHRKQLLTQRTTQTTTVVQVQHPQ